jgi:hypothetical protein
VEPGDGKWPVLFAATFPPGATGLGDLAATAERGGVEPGDGRWPVLFTASLPMPGAARFGDPATAAERAMVDRVAACFGEGFATLPAVAVRGAGITGRIGGTIIAGTIPNPDGTFIKEPVMGKDVCGCWASATFNAPALFLLGEVSEATSMTGGLTVA